MKKNNKLVTILLASSLLLPGIAPLATGVASVSAATETVAADQAFESEYVAVMDQQVRYRALDNSAPITVVETGDSVEFVSEYNNRWFKVRVNDVEGYILRGNVTSKKNLDRESQFIDVPATKESGSEKTYTVAAETALRTKNAERYRPLKALARKTVVTYEGTTDSDRNWFKVKLEDGTPGYVHRSDVTKDANIEADKPAVDLKVSDEGGIYELTAPISSAIRRQAGSQYSIVDEVAKGEVVNYLGTVDADNKWFKVELANKKVGYIHRGDLTKVKLDTTKLEELVAESKKLVEKDYTPASWTNLQNALKLDQNTRAQVTAKVAAIEKAMADLVAAELKVESVSAINATQVEVKFNQAVDKTEAEDHTLNLFEIGGVNPASGKIKLSQDGKTATLTFTSPIEGTKAVVVEPITSKADDNVKSEKYAGVLTYKDTVKPLLTEVKSVTGTDVATSVKLTFSEPVASVGSIKINGEVLAAGSGGTDNYDLTSGDTELVLSNLNLDASKNHTLEIINLEDLATKANVTSYISQAFKAEVDKVAPTVTSVEAKSDTALVFTFSKGVVLDGKTASEYVKLFDEDLLEKTTLLGTNTFSEVTGSNGTKFEVDLNNPFIGTEKTKTFTAQIAHDSAKPILDLRGNKVAKVSKNVTIKKDETAPTLANSSFRTNNDGEVKELVLTFSEDVKLASGTVNLDDLVGTHVINLENNVKVAFATAFPDLVGANAKLSIDTDDARKVIVTVNPEIELSGNYRFDVVKDAVEDLSLAGNGNKASNFALNFGTLSTQETFKVKTGSDKPAATGNVITVKFEVPVKGGEGANSATALSAYTLNGKALPVGTVITLNGTQDEAEIVLPAGTIKDTDTAAIFVADSIVSKDGKQTLEKFTGTVGIEDNVAPELAKVSLTADNNLLVEFSEKVMNESISDFDIFINGIKLDSPTKSDGSTVISPSLTAGAGSDVGKYIINLSDLIEYDSTNTVINLTNKSGGDIVIANSDITSTFKYATSSVIDSIEVKVKSGTRTTEDAENNKLEPGTEIKVK